MTNRTKSEKPTWEQIEKDRDKPVKLPLEAEEALRGLLAVDPEDQPTVEDPAASCGQSTTETDN